MANIKNKRSGCRDVYNAHLVTNATFEGLFEYPVIHPTSQIPERLVAFSKAISSSDTSQWVHFYQNDCEFERLWRNPLRYLPILRRFQGVILPDFSVYRDMPLVMQLWNIYRSRAIGSWLQSCGVETIPNIRWGDSRTLRYCCDGLSPHGTIAIGSHGALRDREDRKYFSHGLKYIVKRLCPSSIVIYGSAPDEIFQSYEASGINIVKFDPDIKVSRKAVH